MQGIAALPTDMAPQEPGPEAPAMGQLSAQEAATLGRLLSKVSQDDIDQLRELANDLKTFSLPELKDFLGGVEYIMANAGNYKQSVRNLIAHGIVQPGDLPAQFVPTFYSILRQMLVDAIKGEEAAPVAEFAKGGLASMAEKVRKAGTGEDTILAHINPQEARMLKQMGGSGTINPQTGIPEYKSFWSKVGTFLKKAAPVILPIALSFIPGIGTAVGAALGVSAAAGSAIVGAVGSGVGGLIAGQKPGQALLSAALGGFGSYALAGGFTGGEGISGLFSGGATGAEGASNAATFQSGPGGINPTVSVDSTGAASVGGTQVPVPNPIARPDAFAATAAAPAAANTQVAGGLGGLFDSATSFVKEHPYLTLGGLGLGAMALGNMNKSNDKPNLVQGPSGSELLAQNPTKYGFNPANFQPQMPRVSMVPSISPAFPNGYDGSLPGNYGVKFAEAGGHISGPGTGTSDSIPARLSDGEFVLTAKAVRGAGDGDRIKGAKNLYKLMNNLERRA